MKFDIVSFGSALVDIFVESEIKERGNLMCYNVGEKIQIKEMDFSIGGGGFNSAVTFSRMGLKTALMTNIGNELLSEKILERLKKEKISFLGIKKGKCGCSIILDSKEKDRTILTFKGANDFFYLKNVKVNTSWFYFSSLVGESYKTQLRIAKTKRYKIAFNPSSYFLKKENVKEILPFIEILILNKEEAEMISKDFKNILNLGPRILIVTDGIKPVRCFFEKKEVVIYPHEKIKVIEKTGAGDAFASGFVASYIKTGDIIESLKVALLNSESVIQYKGSTNKILTWEEVQKDIKKKKFIININ
ncbi:MAG: carbohydrate kinase family protein [Candidatus Pacearchaeota archaeon]